MQEMPGVRGKPWVTMLQSSVSFLAGHDEVYPHFDNILIVFQHAFFQVLSVMVPLADGESEEEELLPSRRASLRSLFLFMLHWWLSFDRLRNIIC